MKKNQRFLIGVLVCFVCLLNPLVQASETSDEGKWISLFNGKDLDGWTPKFTGSELGVNYKDTFQVKDGKLVVSYDKWDKFNGEFGHIFFKDKFSHYRFRLEYRFIGEQVKNGPGWAFRNNGIMAHCQDPATMHKDQEFPVSIEVQLLGGEKNRTTGNLCTPGTNVVMDEKLITNHCTSSNSEKYTGDQWVKAEIEVNGSGIIRHIINGTEVMHYEKPQYDPRDKNAKPLIQGDELLIEEGYISLQAESHSCEFRNIEIMILKE
jgi:hypothetical protein